MTIFDKNLVQIIRSNRKKSALLKVTDNLVQLVVPLNLSDNRIHEIIKKKSAWIKKKLIENLMLPKHKEKEFVSGESFSYLGKNYRLKIIQSTENQVKLKNGYIQVSVSKDGSVRDLLINWYQNLATKHLCEKTNRYAKIIGVCPQSIRVKDYKSKWGSCSIKGEIAFNWKIIMAPHSVIDYLVVHELCHLLEHNHSIRYWKLVEKTLPNHKEQRAWLKNFGQTLRI